MIDYKFRIDLQSERTIYTHTELTTGDAYAYRFWFSFYSDGQPYDISDCMLTVKAKRADGVVLTDAGSISGDGTAYYDVKSDMYSVAGTTSFEVALMTASGGYITTKELVMHTRPGFGEGDITPGSTSPFLATLAEKAMQAADSAAAAAEAARSVTAATVPYDAVSSKLTATTVQGALDELSQKLYAVAGMSELTWANVQKLVRSGLAPQVFSVGDQLICNHTKFGELVWDIIDFDHDVPTDTSRTHSLSLQLHNPVESIMFDAAEAFYYAENGLAAGTYYTTLPAGYEEANGGGKSYYFTLPSAVPAGGQLRFGWSINKNAAESKIVPYADRYTRQETYISVTEGTEGTELAFSNYVRPARFGSNRWKASSVRQWLNSAAAANSWWEPQSSFDRPTPDVGKPGFLNGLDADFLAVIGTVTKRTVKNNEIGGGYEDLTEKIFLPSRSEVFGGNTLDSITYTEEGAPYAYYDTGRSALTKPGVGADTNRTHYKASGTACSFWLRSGTPHNSTAGNIVQSSGAIGYGTYAYNSFPVAPVCNVI